LKVTKAHAARGARDLAIKRGLEFIHRFGNEEKSFAHYGSFLICCFALLAATSRDAKLRHLGLIRAKQLLRRWRQLHAYLPDDANPDLLFDFILVRYAQVRLGMRSASNRRHLNALASKFSVSELIGFDPREEPPPDDLPHRCDCEFQNPRGRKTCKQCKRRFQMRSRYGVWMEALANTYVAERSGILFGAAYADVLQWLRVMRPYPTAAADEEVLRDAIYAVTHVVYTLNDYNTYRLSRRQLPKEFAFLKANIAPACAREDPEVLGELLDALKAFGLRETDPLIIRGTRFLLETQNEDGSWGDPSEENIRTRLHTTWTAIDGLRDLAWRDRSDVELNRS
jgi:hypothetical protein